MSEFIPTHGVFGVSRKVWDDPMFADDEPYTEVQAWLWLLSAATWKERRCRVGKAVVELHRGQLAYSTRFLARKWLWSEAKIRRFLKRLKSAAAIDADTDAGVTRLTICNYDKYQIVGLPSDAPSDAATDAAATQQRRKEEEGKEREEGKKDSGGADAQPEYAFEGETVKLTARDVAQWRKAYPHIADLMAELQAADDYYTENPPADGKWYFRVSNWLKRANNQAGEYDRWEEDYYRSVC